MSALPTAAAARLLARFGPGLLAVVLTMALRWPVSVYADALPRDPNTALHMVIAADVARTGDLFHLGGLDFPEAVAIRVVAVPVVLLAALLGQLLSPVVAFNLAVTAWVAAQGLAMDRLGAAWGWTAPGRAVAVTAAVVSPFALLALGNGQVENVAVLPLCLVAWGAGRNLWATGGGILLAAFCSPYQAVVAGILALARAAPQGLGAVRRVAFAAVLAAVPVIAYYGSQAAPDDLTGDPAAALALQRTRPAPPMGVIGARVDGLVLPRVHRNTQRGVVRSPSERIESAGRAPGWQAPGGLWPIEETTVAGWLGLFALLGGLAGAWRFRRDTRVQGVALAALLCLVLALGDRLRLSEDLVLPVPLPWAVADAVGGPLAAMEATWRFLAGVAFLLAAGLGFGVRRARVALPLCLALVAETLLLAPGAWPVPASAPRVSELAAALPEGPVAVWPGLPVVSTLRHGLVSLALERPVTTYNGPPESQVVSEGYRPTVPPADLAGRDVQAWLTDARAAGVVAIVELTDVPAGLGLPAELGLMPDATVDGFRVYRLVE
jgi:hypothetical protein